VVIPSYALEREMIGQPAQKFIPPSSFGGAGIPPGPVDFPRDDFTPTSVDPSLPPHTDKIAIFASGVSGGDYYHTNDFTTPSSAGGPTWVRQDIGVLGAGGTARGFNVDYQSPRYKRTGTAVNGWLGTQNEIGYITDIFGAPSYAVQHTWSGAPLTTTRAVVMVSRNVPGYVMVVSDDNTPELLIAFTTDGGSTWTEVQVSAFASNAGRGYISHFTVGLADIPGSDSGGNQVMFRTNDSGATWAEVVDPPNDGIAFPTTTTNQGDLHSPLEDNTEERIHYIWWNDGSDLRLSRTELNGALTDISPVVSGDVYGNLSRNALSTSPANRKRVAFIGDTSAPAVSDKLFTSFNGGDTWVQKQESNLYSDLWMASDNAVYLLGATATPISYSPDFLVTIDNRVGNFADVVNGSFAGTGLAGG